MSANRIVELIFGILGFGMIWYASNWIVALGLFFALFANNIAHSREL